MKKAIIALVSLAGLSAADSLDYDIYKNNTKSPYLTNLFTVWDFDQTAGTKAAKVGGSKGGYNDTPTITYAPGNTTDGYGLVNSTSTPYKAGDIGWSDFTVSFDINKATTGTLLDLVDSNNKHISISSSSTSTPFTLNYDDITGSVVSSVNPTSSTGTLGWKTITLTRSSSTLTLYVDGVKQGSMTGDTASIENFQFANKFGGGSNITAEVDNMTLWSRALSDTEVSGFIVPTSNVPEPTTATLSLLALAGLAARRRRH